MPFLDPANEKHVKAEERLHGELVGWLTTVNAEGQPQSTPVWFLWDGETFLMYSQRDAPKVDSLRANAQVSLHLEGDGVGGDVVTFEGTAELLVDGPPADRVPDYMTKYGPRIDFYGWTAAGFSRDYPHAVRITPTRARIW